MTATTIHSSYLAFSIFATTIVFAAGGQDTGSAIASDLTNNVGNHLPSGHSADLYFDSKEPPIDFAARDLKRTLESKGFVVSMKSLADLRSSRDDLRIIITREGSPEVRSRLAAEGGQTVGMLGEQDYAIRATKTKGGTDFWVVGGRIGAMYGALDMAETIAAEGIQSITNGDHTPYFEKRGIKFNAPLDQRIPSHDDRGTAAQSNVAQMWEMSFWKDYLDELARTRYNVLCIWSKHPFPTMVKVPDYPKVALDDVYNASGKVKTMTIDEKIAFWKQVMDYAYDRGIEVSFMVWNIHMSGVDGKYGITEDKTNAITKDYLRKSVAQFFFTYPRLVGIGVTAGEHMDGMSDDEKEQWMWDTYGKGVQDVEKAQPNRHILFIHRDWQTSFEKIEGRFSQLRDGFDMEFKYAQGHMYSSYNPPFAEGLLRRVPPGIKTWWNIRNDDIYNLRWGDPDYARQFILHFPKDRTAGYMMGSDRYAWGRESISKNPRSPRQLENSKHWYSFRLWGQLGYDPNTPDTFFQGFIQNKFPSVPGDELYTAWKSSSEIIPLVNRFHWFSWDYQWWVEACHSTGFGDALPGFHTVRNFITTPVMQRSGLMTIPQYVDNTLNGKTNPGTTPLQVADQLEAPAALALDKTSKMTADGNIELSETIGDIKAMSYLGLYYAKKIRGATDLALFDASKKVEYKNSAVAHLREALEQWKNYAATLDRQYNPMNISMQGVFDWNATVHDVEKDISIAENAN